MLTTFRQLASLTTDVPTIAAALADSELVEVSDSKTQLRRKTPIPDLAEVDARTLYCVCATSSPFHFI